MMNWETHGNLPGEAENTWVAVIAIFFFSRLPLKRGVFFYLNCVCACLRHFFEKFEDIYLFEGDIWQMNDENKIC